MKLALALTLCAACFSFAATGARGGTTGTLTGRVLDRDGRRPLAGARVTIASPSQSATTETNASGAFTFVSLAPDSYAVSAEFAGYEPQSLAGVAVFADQARTVVFELGPVPKLIANVRSRAPALVRPGTTSDVYSLDAVQARAASTLTGSGSLNQAYGAIASVPGVVVPQGQQGWYQFVYIRGGAQDQDGWELDGIPVNRAYDNAPQTMLSSLGQQELQIYTGGVPATSDASGIAGYVNQVIKTGTSPGYAGIALGAGTPAFYHAASAEIGGATPDRLFSYYAGLLGADQAYRYLNQFNGAGSPGFFYPLDVPTNNGYVYDGSGPAVFSPGNSYGLANTQDRETIVNLHLGIPHRSTSLRDDVQLLYDTGGIGLGFYSSIDDLGARLVYDTFGTLKWADGVVYAGNIFAPVNPSDFVTYSFPSSPSHTVGAALLPSIRDTNANGMSLVKLQYQHTMSNSAFVRVFGYTLYSSWFEYGPVSAVLPWGDAVSDYENIAHTGGLNGQVVDQVAGGHLLTASGSWSNSTMMRYSPTGSFPAGSSSYFVTNYVGANGLCYNYQTGRQIGCYDNCYDPTTGQDETGSCGAPGDVLLRERAPGTPLTPLYSCGGATPPPACGEHPQWLATEAGYQAEIDTVSPTFTSAALSDYWNPSDRLAVNAGLRLENYSYALANTANGYPARAFWFASYNAEYCFGPGLAEPIARTPLPGGALLGPCPPGTSPVHMVDSSGGVVSSTQWQPRFAAAYTMGRDDVLRASYGVYAQPANTAWAQYNTQQQDLASWLGKEFYAYGFNSPAHAELPARSYNADFSWEHRLAHSPLSFKLTPFYRSTADQLQSFDINPLTGLRSGLNVGHQVSAGVEFEAQLGDLTRNGLSAILSYTYTHSAIRYTGFSNGGNVIDNLNAYIQQYNSYTKACATPNPVLCGSLAGNAVPVFTNVYPGGTVTRVTNPYYNEPAQPLLDPNAWYPVYDVIPAPFAGANGHETPSVAALVLNYKRDKLTVTPTLALSSGAEYGSPLVWPGYVPQLCSATYPGTHSAIGKSCYATPIQAHGTLPALPYIFTPDRYTGSFDALGAFRQPARLTLNLQTSYALSPRLSVTAQLLDLVDRCYLRGYPWENPNICVYGALPPSSLAPAGNFVPSAQTPPQLRYPYGMWLNNTEVGALGTAVPFQAVVTVQLKL